MKYSIEVEQYSLQAKEDFRPIIADHRFGRYCADWTLDIEAARQLELDTLYNYLQNNPSTSWVAIRKGQVIGLLSLQKSIWDTNFWGVEYVSIDQIYTISGDESEQEYTIDQLLNAAVGWCHDNKIQFVSVRASTYNLAAIHALEKNNFRYIESTVINSNDIRHSNFQLPEDYKIRMPYKGETDTLVNMVEDAFITHRFYADPRFPKVKVDDMYRKWVINSLESPNWSTIVLESDGKARGFFIYRIEDLRSYFKLRFAKWRMGVLSSSNHSKGYGVPLFQGSMQYVHDTADIIDSGLSIRNIRSFNLHNKLNFRIICFSSTYHKWFD